jgi:hypothetical protein
MYAVAERGPYSEISVLLDLVSGDLFQRHATAHLKLAEGMRTTIITEPYGSVADIAFWPLLLSLAFLAFKFHSNRMAVVSCSLLLIAIIFAAIMHDLAQGTTSLAALHDFEIAQLIISGGFFILFVSMAYDFVLNKWPKDRRFLGVFVIAVALLSFAGIVSATASLFQDLALPSYTVEGEITFLARKGRSELGRTNWKYVGPNIVQIGDVQLQASTGLYYKLRLGQHVRVEASRGSDFIRRLERSPRRNHAQDIR